MQINSEVEKIDIWEEVWRKCGKVWKIYPIVGTVNSVAI